VASTYERLFKNGTVVNQDGIGVRDVAVRAGRIAAIGEIAAGAAGEVIDCTGLTVLPGVIDTHVHFREPGGEHKEDLASGSLSAVMGGVTTVFEMPNTSPPTVTADALAGKLARAVGRMHCDFAFFVGGTHANAGYVDELERLPGAAGIKVFMGASTGDLLVADDDGLNAILARTRRRVSVHAEDEPRLRERAPLRREGDAASHPVWRDEIAALKATERLVAAARRHGARVHLLHVSTAAEMDFIAEHKDYVSVEVTPQHLTLDDSAYGRLGTRLQMNPPIRAATHRDRLWRAVGEGLADVLGSDHAPHTIGEKARTYPASPSGMPGVQTLVPVMLDHVAAGRLSLARFADLASAGPARIFGIAGKGRIAVGFDADLTVVDLKRRRTITDAWIASRCGWTPFDGMAVAGWPVGTVLRGERVMWEGSLLAAGTGQPVRFLEVLPRPDLE
jgi:dihydroorotase